MLDSRQNPSRVIPSRFFASFAVIPSPHHPRLAALTKRSERPSDLQSPISPSPCLLFFSLLGGGQKKPAPPTTALPIPNILAFSILLYLLALYCNNLGGSCLTYYWHGGECPHSAYLRAISRIRPFLVQDDDSRPRYIVSGKPLLKNSTDFNSYVTVCNADGAPVRDNGFMAAGTAPGLGVTPRANVIDPRVVEIV